MAIKNVTIQQICNIAEALGTMSVSVPMRYKDARRLNDITKLFNERRSIFVDEERKLIGDCGGTIGSNGAITFETNDATALFMRRRNEMLREEDDVDFTPVDLSHYAEYITLHSNAIDILDGVIIFDACDK